MLLRVPMSPKLLNWLMSSLVSGAIDLACVDLSNFEVPYLWLGTFINESIRFRDVFMVRMAPLSGIPFDVLIWKAGMLSIA